MTNKKRQSPIAGFRIGDRVKIRHFGGRIGRIAELSRLVGPDGMATYRVLISRKPRRAYMMLTADQMDAAPKPTGTPLSIPAHDEIDLAPSSGLGESEV